MCICIWASTSNMMKNALQQIYKTLPPVLLTQPLENLVCTELSWITDEPKFITLVEPLLLHQK